MCVMFGTVKLHVRKVAAIVFGHYTAICQLLASELLVICHMQSALLHDSHVIFSLLSVEETLFCL